MKRRILIVSGAAIAAVAAAGLAVTKPWTWQPLDLSKITSPAQAALILDRGGGSAADAGVYRFPLAADDIPERVRQAFVAIEDARFYRHAGLDLWRIGGALLADIRAGEAREGASTITQQLVKLTHLSGEKTLARKAQEAWLALGLERVMDKDEILAAYLNTVYLGAGAYGVEAAARVYFGCGANGLTLPQAATLAGIVKAPSRYAPHLNPDKALERRNLTLQAMAENGYISEDERDEALSAPLGLNMSERTGRAGWYVDAALEEACAALNISSDELMSGGYRVYTALDPALQASADALFADPARFPEASDGAQCESALVAMDVNTGEILCMEGGRDYAVRRGFNRAVQMKRQPGSAFKPVSVYAAAVDMLGCTPITLLDDTPREYDGYTPSNASGQSHGTVTLRQALVKSMNQATVNLLDRVGIDAARLYAQKLGFTLNDADRSYALGVGALTDGVSPASLCAAYCALANGGMAVAPHTVRRVEDSEGREVYAFSSGGSRALSDVSAYLLTDILRDAAANGTAKALAAVPVPVAAKTGTVGETDGGNRDAWTVAYTPSLAIAVWMGCDEPDKHELRQGVTGGSYPARLAAAFLADNASRAGGEFVQPAGVERALLDSRSLRGDIAFPMLASGDTPAACLLNEALPVGSAPKQASTLWKYPTQVETVYVQSDGAGRPLVSFVAPDSVSVWRVMRASDTDWTEIARLEGKRGDYLTFTDQDAPDGAVRYAVIARQKYFEELGQIIDAAPSDETPLLGATLFERLFGTA
ncbi:MAG: PBP1A family penicillin-binding protein [Clostridia bacterium]|nr:PBP1A family penicillin-binding protein [Clostridia bacterium]